MEKALTLGWKNDIFCGLRKAKVRGLISLGKRKGPYEPHGDVSAPSAPWKRRAVAGECAAHAPRGRKAAERFARGWWAVRMLFWPRCRATYPVLSNLLVSRAGRRIY